MIKLIVIKQFTSGILRGMSYTDQIAVRSVSDLDLVDKLGQEVESCAGGNYKVAGVSIWNDELGYYVTRKQAEWRLKGF